MYFLLKMGIFHCYVSLPEGSLMRFFWGWQLWNWGVGVFNHKYFALLGILECEQTPGSGMGTAGIRTKSHAVPCHGPGALFEILTGPVLADKDQEYTVLMHVKPRLILQGLTRCHVVWKINTLGCNPSVGHGSFWSESCRQRMKFSIQLSFRNSFST